MRTGKPDSDGLLREGLVCVVVNHIESGDCRASSQSANPKCQMALSCGLYCTGSGVW